MLASSDVRTEWVHTQQPGSACTTALSSAKVRPCGGVVGFLLGFVWLVGCVWECVLGIIITDPVVTWQSVSCEMLDLVA